jgi:hypothetical protein
MGAQRIAKKTWHMKMPTCKFCSSIFIISHILMLCVFNFNM